MTLKAPKINSHSGMVSATTVDDISGSPNGTGGAGAGGANGNGNGNGNFLVISSGPSSAPLTATHLNVNVRRNTLNAKLANLEANNAGVHANGSDLDATEEGEDGAEGAGSSKGAEGSGGEDKKKAGRVKFQLKNEDLVDIKDLGSGNGGSVKKVEHLPTKTYMAKKVRRCCCISRLTAYSYGALALDGAHRCQTLRPKANHPRASNYGRLSLEIHRLFLRRLPC